VLANYLSQTARLLQLPAAPSTLYSTADLTAFINLARGQLAGEAECIRKIGTLATVAAQQPYDFSSINLGTASITGIQGVINVRRIAYATADGRKWIPPRAWEWFDIYDLNIPEPVPGVPKSWSQYAQGSAPTGTGSGQGGSFYIAPPPDAIYTLSLDCTCYPIALVDDTTVEAIPYLWTDAVPFFAAYYALLSAQTQARRADAEAYYNYYQTFVQRARESGNPSVGRWQYAQAKDPVQANKLGIKAAGGG